MAYSVADWERMRKEAEEYFAEMERDKQRRRRGKREPATPYGYDNPRLITKRYRFEIFARDGFRCQICGRSAQDGVKLVVDHRFPVVLGGTRDPENLWTLCFDCNAGKLDRMLPVENPSKTSGTKSGESVAAPGETAPIGTNPPSLTTPDLHLTPRPSGVRSPHSAITYGCWYELQSETVENPDKIVAMKRANGEGCVYYDKAIRKWKAIAPYPNRLTRTGSTQAEAIRRRDEALARQGVARAHPRQKAKDFFAYWLIARQRLVGPRTHERDDGLVRHYIYPVFGEKLLQNVTPLDCQNVLDRALAKGLRPTTVAEIRRVLLQALGHADDMEVINRNPAEKTKSLRITKSAARPLHPDELKALLAKVKGERDEALFLLYVIVGLRRGEALALNWQDVDLDAGTLAITKSLQRYGGELHVGAVKTTNSRRTIPIPVVVVDALRERRKTQLEDRIAHATWWQESDLVFTTQIGTPLEPRNVNRSITALFKRAKVERRRVHDLRHTAATMLLRRNVPVASVSAVLGHADAAITHRVYNHLVPGGLEHAASVMQEISEE